MKEETHPRYNLTFAIYFLKVHSHHLDASPGRVQASTVLYTPFCS